MGLKSLGASVLLTGFVVAQTVMVRFSRGEDGKLPYNPATANLITECIKLIVSTIVWWIYDRTSEYNGLAGVNLATVSLFAIPGMIYAIQNCLIFYALVYLEAPTFQVFASVKIVTTALLFRLILQRVLTTVQWVALFQLFASMIITKLGALVSSSSQNEASNLTIGASILFCNSWLSAFSGITNEWLVKHQDSRAPLMMKSIQLYSWGAIINLVGLMMTDSNMITSFGKISPLVWAIIINNAAVGLSVALIMKYADNIVKCFSTAAAVFISAVLSSMFLNFKLDIAFIAGLFVYSTAFFLYFGNHNPVLKSAGLDDSQFWVCSANPMPKSNKKYKQMPKPRSCSDLSLLKSSKTDKFKAKSPTLYHRPGVELAEIDQKNKNCRKNLENSNSCVNSVGGAVRDLEKEAGSSAV